MYVSHVGDSKYESASLASAPGSPALPPPTSLTAAAKGSEILIHPTSNTSHALINTIKELNHLSVNELQIAIALAHERIDLQRKIAISHLLEDGREHLFLSLLSFNFLPVSELQTVITLAHKRIDLLSKLAISVAIEREETEVLGLLSNPAINPGADDNSLIQAACRNDWKRVLSEILTDPRVNPAVKENMPFKLAAVNNSVACIRMLLSDPRVDPTVDNGAAVFYAHEKGQTAIVNLLLADPRVNPHQHPDYNSWLADPARCLSSM
jgi:hypothetical protein